MAEQEKWKWQEPKTTWKGIGLYHVTLTIPDRKPLLGCLEVPDNDPCKAKVRRTVLGKVAEHGDVEPLRNYMNSCVLWARQGVVMVSPFISSHEKQVMQVLLREKMPFIYLADNGFRDYYKPSDALFDACAAGSVLIL
ncbi:MAG: hypothetical protein IKH01_01220, partial [Prevotella sp.]|nr:hypothetical protein [Prevotella sp.]